MISGGWEYNDTFCKNPDSSGATEGNNYGYAGEYYIDSETGYNPFSVTQVCQSAEVIHSLISLIWHAIQLDFLC